MADGAGWSYPVSAKGGPAFGGNPQTEKPVEIQEVSSFSYRTRGSSLTSWLTLAPGNKISGGRVLSSKSRRSSNRAAALFRIAAVNVGRTQTALGAFYRRVGARVGKAKAVTATARKLAVLFYNAVRFGLAYVDPGTDYYERHYQERVLHNLQRRARQLGYTLVETAASSPHTGVS